MCHGYSCHSLTLPCTSLTINYTSLARVVVNNGRAIEYIVIYVDPQADLHIQV